MEYCDERIDPTLTYLTEYEEWARNGCTRAEILMSDKDTDND